MPWTGRAGAVSSAAGHDNGRCSGADPRQTCEADSETPTSFALTALQSLVDPEEQLELDDLSDADRRERIGNAVRPDAATAIADTIGKTLLLAWSGES